ncbi:MAG: YeiH family protein [Synergistaceae bacterium]|nr:YeiH family protein [Synergistaceae bacterium]
MIQIRKITPGMLLCVLISLPAWFLGKAFPVVGSPVFGILAGMLLIMAFPALLRTERRRTGNNSPAELFRLDDGVKYTSKKILQYSIILLGFGMDLFHVIKVGGQSLYVIAFTLTASFLTAYFVGRALKLEGKTTALIGIGTSICGGSAIAAAAPVIGAKDEDVAHAISTIFLFNIIAVFIFPALGAYLGMSDTGFGMWAGTAINDTSSVVAAGTAWSNAAGNNTALGFATIVKLTRTLMIVPVTLVLAVCTAWKAQKDRSGEHRGQFSFIKVFPWFVIGFVAAAVINTFWSIPAVSAPLVTAGKFMIVMAMTAIGLNTNIKKLLTNGLKPLFLGVCCWAAVAVVSLIVQKFIGIW